MNDNDVLLYLLADTAEDFVGRFHNLSCKIPIDEIQCVGVINFSVREYDIEYSSSLDKLIPDSDVAKAFFELDGDNFESNTLDDNLEDLFSQRKFLKKNVYVKRLLAAFKHCKKYLEDLVKIADLLDTELKVTLGRQTSTPRAIAYSEFLKDAYSLTLPKELKAVLAKNRSTKKKPVVKLVSKNIA